MKISELENIKKEKLTLWQTIQLDFHKVIMQIKESKSSKERLEAKKLWNKKIEEHSHESANIFKRYWDLFTELWHDDVIRKQLWIKLESAVTFIVILNYIVVMLSTYTDIWAKYEWIFNIIEIIFVTIYAIEIIIRIAMESIEGKWWYFFWLNPKKKGEEISQAKTKLFWNYFDLLITLTAIAAHHPALSSMRILRCFRLFSLFTVSKNLRLISDAIVNSLKSISWAGVMLFVVFSIFSVFGCQIYGDSGFFNNAGQGMITLFHMMTLDDAGRIMHDLSYGNNYTYLFFFVFIIITAFVIMNVITGAIVQSMAETSRKERMKQRALKNDSGKAKEGIDSDIHKLKMQIIEMQKTIDKLEEPEN